jgi:transcriptional regulator with XRE-family HTH domain
MTQSEYASNLSNTTFYINLHIVLYRLFVELAVRGCVFSIQKRYEMPRKAKTAGATKLGVRIGRNIKIARTRLGITQSELAEAIDVETVTASRIETGVQLPAIDRLEAIAKILKVPLTTLLADTSKNSGYAELLSDVMQDLPAREREFLYGFAVSYAQHYKAGKKK